MASSSLPVTINCYEMTTSIQSEKEEEFSTLIDHGLSCYSQASPRRVLTSSTVVLNVLKAFAIMSTLKKDIFNCILWRFCLFERLKWREKVFGCYIHFFSKFHSVALYIRSAIPMKYFVSFLFIYIFFAQMLSSDSYVYTREGETQTYLHKRLVGRQRREAEREILSILGLNHRPRIHNLADIESLSAPRYMLGLYNTASHSKVETFAGSVFGFLESEIGTLNELDSSLDNVVASSSDLLAMKTAEEIQIDLSSNLRQYIEYNESTTDEIGVLEANYIENLFTADDISERTIRDDFIDERKLLDDSDMIISFINTKQQIVDDVSLLPSMELRLMLRRHRSFYFDISQTSENDRLGAARFRLYKEKCESSLGNQSLRINVHQVVSGESTTVYLHGSRLVGSHQEGWLVFDVTNVLRDWITRPENNFGLKVTVETLQGRHLNPTKTGLIGRKGSSSKQAFIVAFFNQNKPDLIRPNLRRRIRRTADLGVDVTSSPEDDDDFDNHEVSNSSESIASNQTPSDDEFDESNFEDDDDDEFEEDDEDLEFDNEEVEDDSRTMSKRKTKGNKARKKGRKRKNFPKNSSTRRKPVIEHCQRKQFNVDFKDLGWNTWIIAPKSYKAYQCLGKCSFPLNAGLNATNHAIVQSLVHVRLEHLNIPEPCCTPSKLEPLEILYFNDQSKVIYKKYRDMVVSSCGCH